LFDVRGKVRDQQITSGHTTTLEPSSLQQHWETALDNSMSAEAVSRPAWQTDELAEAWIDEEEYQESVDGIQTSIRR
jgi:hypothetical protein